MEHPTEELMKAVYADADLLAGLEAYGEVVLLAENCELIPVYSPRDIIHVVERIGPRSR